MAVILNRPDSLNIANIKTWVEEQIWGHRFYNDQSPWMLMLEFLGLCAHKVTEEGSEIFDGLQGETHEDFSYLLHTREALRYLLFQDRHLDECQREAFASDSARFEAWLQRASTDGPTDYTYLKKRFIDFSSLANTIILLRSAEVEQSRTRRPTSRHLAPQGPAMMMADYGPSKGAATPDRRFFARGGELLYLMLNRSSRREGLEQLLRARLLSDDNQWCDLTKRLSPEVGGSSLISLSLGYLPLSTHPRYDALAEDWEALLSIAEMPNDYLLEPLMRLSAFAVILYLSERAAKVLEAPPPAIPVDMVSAGQSALRKLSIEHFHQHRQITRDAISRFVDDVTETEGWKAALVAPNQNQAARDVLHAHFSCRKILSPGQTPSQQLETVRAQALKNHGTHLGAVSGFYAQEIGLAISRRGAGRWYSLSDSLLEALVLANVREPLEYTEFLERLRERYHLVISPAGAEATYEELPAPREQFKTNQERLEERLRVLGLLRRLSDDCAFVENPFA